MKWNRRRKNKHTFHFAAVVQREVYLEHESLCLLILDYDHFLLMASEFRQSLLSSIHRLQSLFWYQKNSSSWSKTTQFFYFHATLDLREMSLTYIGNSRVNPSNNNWFTPVIKLRSFKAHRSSCDRIFTSTRVITCISAALSSLLYRPTS